MRAVRCGIGSAGVRVMGAGSAARFEAHLCGRALKLLSPLDAYAGGRRRAPCPLEGALRRGWRPTLGSAPGKSQNVPGSVIEAESMRIGSAHQSQLLGQAWATHATLESQHFEALPQWPEP